MLRFIILLSWSLLSVSLIAQTNIAVKASDFKNEELVFYKTSDYISNITDTVAIVNTDANGAFSVNIDLNYTQQIFIDLGVYHCWFYAEPSRKQYVLNFPEKRVKTKVEELNIFFEPIGFILGIDNNPAKDLNRLIVSFDKIYTQFLAENFDSIYLFPQTKLIDEFEKGMNHYYSDIQHPYFNTYRAYKYYELRYLGPNRSYKTITFNYYNNKQIHYNNQSYMHLFNEMYNNFFNIYADAPEGEKLLNYVTEGRSVVKLQRYLDNNAALSDSLLEELIILKSIHDEFFNPRDRNNVKFPIPQMKIIIDSILNFSPIPEHRKIAGNIIKKFNRASIKNSNIPSDFKLLNYYGDSVSLDQFKGKYIYLGFMRTDVIPAMESMDRMINFYKQHSDDIEMVSIFTDEKSNFSRLDTSKYKWTLLHIGKNKHLLEDYKVITWPKFYLINPEGKFIWNPAPSMEENFEIKYFELVDPEGILQKEKKKKVFSK